jgi:hypothetical protein
VQQKPGVEVITIDVIMIDVIQSMTNPLRLEMADMSQNSPTSPGVTDSVLHNFRSSK